MMEIRIVRLKVCKGGHGIEWDGHVGRGWDGMGWDGNPTVIFVLPIPPHSHPSRIPTPLAPT